MTGIAAVFADGLLSVRMQSMTDVLSRNPHDARDQWSNGKMGLSACTLFTTAEAKDANQPHCSEDGQRALVFDGFLTNCAELRRELLDRGASLRNRSDEELVLRSYEEWGDDCALRTEGEFAFVIADCRRQTLFCARDHQGLRPLFYCQNGEALIAASSIAAVLAGLDRQPDFDYDYLAEAMVGETYSVDRTPWKGVKRLNASHCLITSPGQIEVRRYYSLPSQPIRHYRSDEEYIEAYRDVLRDAIRRTSRTHLPLAIEVSGGLDSSAIYALAHDMMGTLPAPEIRAYTLRGEAGAESDEIAFARSVTDFTDSDLTESELFRPDLDWFDAEGKRERDLPTYTNASHSILMEQAMAKDGARVTLNGQGGDQWLDGSFGYYHQTIQSRQVRRFLKNLRRDIATYGTRSSVGFALRKMILAALPKPVRLALKRSRSDYGSLMVDPVQYLDAEYAASVRSTKTSYLAALPFDEIANANARTLDAKLNQRSFDLMARQRARLGLEGRSPMCTRQFIEFAASVPEDVKFRNGQTKWLHREAMRGFMPDAVVDRPDKASFPEAKHDQAILRMCQTEMSGVLAPLVNSEQFSAFNTLRIEHDFDDIWDWPYWGCYLVTSFLQNSNER
ncbi:asparagine synthetase B family protein [Erythrobacter crassostreae]|uniref:asparagine synthase (glutamine-hydrolyzing) n=1 Tax=Erythrobacter crassostreae TaxID=2828328 RepID=A0A9X1JM05_9SPHN|nr:asparagine synthase-related protein [Erythrobacter crassostrea]MBV7258293.1 hypothetical protein [Erythrobacter crassostrea]